MEVPTPQPVEKNVFKRLFKDRNADARTNSLKSSGAVKPESQKKMPHKTVVGRQVSSKFSASKENQPMWSVRKVANAGPKQDAQGLHVSKKFGLKTPATTSRLKQVEKTPPTVRLARSKLQSARYWLSLVDVAEKAGKHEVSMKLFELALESGAQPAADLHRSWTAYKNRYQIPTETKDGASETQIVQCDPAPLGAPEIRSMVKACDAESVIAEETTNVVTIKNLYAEAYSQVSISSVDFVSEVVNEAEPVNGDTASNSPPEAVPPRRTPRRACAIRAALRLEESAKKSTRRKAHKNDAVATSSGMIADVENMDVNMLMKEVVSGMLSGAQPEPLPKRPDLKSAKKAQQPTATAAASPQVKVGPGSNSKTKTKTKKDTDAFPVVNEAVKAKWTRTGEAGHKTVAGAQCATHVASLGRDDKDRKPAKESETPVGAKSQVKKAAAQATTSEATPDPRRSARLLRSTTASRGSSHD